MKKAILFLSILAFCGFLVTSVNAATFTVTKTADTNDGVCNADCSLREALIAVNNNIPGGATHRIEFSSLFDAPQTLETTQFFLDYNTRVEIIGRGNLTTTITTASGSLNGAFQINSAYCKITNLRFADCNNELDGGAIFGNDGGDLIIERCLFENNFGYSGGALDLRAFTSVTIRDSTFRDNQAYGLFGEGGAVFLENYSQVIARSTFSGNQSPNGSVAYFSGYVSATTGEITNSTFAGNNASNGSIIRNTSGIMDLRNVTVAGNTASATAIDTFNNATTQIRLTNSIVAGNSSGNVSGNVTLIAPNITGASPMLGPLAFNGGETQTRALLAGSPAIDAGSLTGAPTTDQRGAARPFGTGVDLGAFESGVVVTSANTPIGSNVNTSLGSVSLTFSGVSTAGTTTQIPISPSGIPPSGYTFGAGFPAFQISTTAVYTPPVTICLAVPLSTPLATFNALEILHFENGAWVALAPTTRDVPSYTICAPTNTLSPFAIAENLAPTAAEVSITGRVATANGHGIRGARMVLTSPDGTRRTAITSTFGNYAFDGVEVGHTYVMEIASKRYTFANATRIISLQDHVTDMDFIAEPL